MKTEAQVLAQVVDSTRQYNRMYLSALKDLGPLVPISLNG